MSRNGLLRSSGYVSSKTVSGWGFYSYLTGKIELLRLYFNFNDHDKHVVHFLVRFRWDIILA